MPADEPPEKKPAEVKCWNCKRMHRAYERKCPYCKKAQKAAK